MNNALRAAMANAKMTQSQLAAVCGVDPKTIGRWLLDAGRVPYVQHRLAASDALGVEVGVLWPSAAQTLVKTGPDRELVAMYPYRSAAPASLWRQLVTKAQSEIVFAGYTNYFLWLE